MKHDMLYVYEVYKERSFSQASKNLYVSQPALSSFIRKVETEIGMKIFDRNTLPIRLTEAGKLYVQAIERIMAIEKDLENNLNDLADMRKGRVVVAGANFFSAYMLPPVIRAFEGNYPGIELELIESDSTALYEEAQKGNIDLILDGGVYDSALFDVQILFTENIVFGVPKNNPLNQRFSDRSMTREQVLDNQHLSQQVKPVELSAFANEKFILLKRGHDMNVRSHHICKSTGFSPRSALHLNQLSTVYNMGEQGMGCCFLTDTVINLAQKGDSSMLFYRIDNSEAKRDVFIAWQKNKAVTRAMEMFLQIAKNIYH